VVAEEEIEGRHVYRIDSRLTTGAIRTDLAALLAALAQYPEMLGGSDPAELEAGLAQFESMGVGVAIEMREATSTMTTWFDPAAGIVVRAALDNPMTMTMSMRGIPGGDVEVIMDMRSEQRLTLAA
jgi:urea transporter